jgi:hypothetical protein
MYAMRSASDTQNATSSAKVCTFNLQSARAVATRVAAMMLCTMWLSVAQAGHATGQQGQTWASIAKLPDWQGIWQLDWEHNPKLLGGMAPGPLTPTAQAKLDKFLALQKNGENLQTQDANCLPTGMPGIMTEPYPIEFLFNPGMVVMLIETFSQVRHVYTNGETHPADPDPAFNGHSIGYWDGDTLIVDTVGIDTTTRIAPGVEHGAKLHVVERIRKIDPDHIQIERTIDDPQVLAKPWKVILLYARMKGHMREYVCEQNNRDSADAQGRPDLRIDAPKH